MCNVCGNDYDKSFTVTWAGGRSATFDSIECAAVEVGPRCAHCDCRILGHGIEVDQVTYCCAHCARMAAIPASTTAIPPQAAPRHEYPHHVLGCADNPTARRIFAHAARFTALVVAASLAALGFALWSVHGCKSGRGPSVLDHCSAVQRNFLAVGAPLVLFLGVLCAFGRTIQIWRKHRRWWIWQGAGRFMLVLLLVVLTMTTPIAAP